MINSHEGLTTTKIKNIEIGKKKKKIVLKHIDSSNNDDFMAQFVQFLHTLQIHRNVFTDRLMLYTRNTIKSTDIIKTHKYTDTNTNHTHTQTMNRRTIDVCFG